jgi:ATP-dependent DNA helicase RecG
VVEVGVDVPNATVMVIEHAERFGLAQLHQLRGRVGRGREPSYCLLMQGSKAISLEAAERLTCLQETTDGFVIAEKDLEIRGPGEFFGTRQSGLPTLRVAHLLRDRRILETARREAAHFVDNLESQPSSGQWAAGLSSSWQTRYGLVGVG